MSKIQDEAKELSLPVPWGHVAAKAWGSSADFPVLCVHGILDNAGAFDRLIAHLPKNYYYVAIDLPGHGFSSHFPPELPLDFFEYVLTLRYILEELQWKTFYYIGHSLGGQLGTFYSILYPEQVQKLILFEGVVPFTFYDEELVPQLKKILDSPFKANNENRYRLYTRDEVMYTLKCMRPVCLKTDAAEAIFKRSVSEIGGLFKYNRDYRLKSYMRPLLNIDQMIEITSNFNVKTLVFITRGTLESISQKRIVKLATNFLENMNNIRIIYVDGNHDIHNNYPEKVSEEITTFFNSVNISSKL